MAGLAGSRPAVGSDRVSSALSYADILRTLGVLLEQSGSSSARLRISRQDAQVAATGWRWPQDWTMEMLCQEAARQSRERGDSRLRHRRPDLLAGCLRVLGADLDESSGGPYLVTVQPTYVQVQHQDGSVQTTELESLQKRARHVAEGRSQAPSTAAAGPPVSSVNSVSSDGVPASGQY